MKISISCYNIKTNSIFYTNTNLFKGLASIVDTKGTISLYFKNNRKRKVKIIDAILKQEDIKHCFISIKINEKRDNNVTFITGYAYKITYTSIVINKSKEVVYRRKKC